MSDASTIAYSITSNESSIQPSDAATNGVARALIGVAPPRRTGRSLDVAAGA